MSNWQERILRVQRHVGRHFIDAGDLHASADGNFQGFAGAGVHPVTGEAHISPSERARAVEIGKTLYVPKDWDAQADTIYVGPSPLVRAEMTSLAMAEGELLAYNARQLGIPEEKLEKAHTLPPELKAELSDNRLKFSWNPGNQSLNEATYKALKDEGLVADHGNQLFVEASNQDAYKGGFRYQAQVAFDGEDPRCNDHPEEVAYRALSHMVPLLKQHRIVEGASHTWNLEAIMATLNGNGVGTDGNQLYDNAGGDFDQGGYLQAVVEVNKNTGELAPTMQLSRTADASKKKQPGYDGGSTLHMPQEMSTDVLMQYARK